MRRNSIYTAAKVSQHRSILPRLWNEFLLQFPIGRLQSVCCWAIAILQPNPSYLTRPIRSVGPIMSGLGQPKGSSTEHHSSASGNASVKSAEAGMSSTEARGKRDDSLKAHFRFLWLTILASCALIEYGFDQGIIGSFQAMVGFLKVFGYEDPRVPSGWVSTLFTVQPPGGRSSKKCKEWYLT